MRGTVLDISKKFNKVWYEGLIFDVEGNLLKLLENYLTDGQQRVVLNVQTSSSQNVYAGFPRGFVLVSLLFLIYINDLTHRLTSMYQIFADDIFVFKSD